MCSCTSLGQNSSLSYGRPLPLSGGSLTGWKCPCTGVCWQTAPILLLPWSLNIGKSEFENYRIIYCKPSLWNDPHVCPGLRPFKQTGQQVIIQGNTGTLSHLVWSTSSHHVSLLVLSEHTSEACWHGPCEGSGCVFRWTYTFPLLVHHPLMQLISLPGRDGCCHFSGTPPGLGIPSVGKLSSAPLQQLDRLGNKKMVKIE